MWRLVLLLLVLPSLTVPQMVRNDVETDEIWDRWDFYYYSEKMRLLLRILVRADGEES